jgi:hypothetical protein
MLPAADSEMQRYFRVAHFSHQQMAVTLARAA